MRRTTIALITSVGVSAAGIVSLPAPAYAERASVIIRPGTGTQQLQSSIPPMAYQSKDDFLRDCRNRNRTCAVLGTKPASPKQPEHTTPKSSE